jgi:hypothetical protein
MPYADTAAMQAFLDCFAETIADDEHAVMVLDQAGWHGSNNTVSKFESGKVKPNPSTVQVIQLALERHGVIFIDNGFEGVKVRRNKQGKDVS